MGGCSAVNCTNNSRKGWRLFKFPSEKERRKKWIINCGRSEDPGPSALLCSAHFEVSQYECNRADNWRKLKPNAIPTLFDFTNRPAIVLYEPEKQNNLQASNSVAAVKKEIPESCVESYIYPAAYCEVKQEFLEFSDREQSSNYNAENKTDKEEKYEVTDKDLDFKYYSNDHTYMKFKNKNGASPWLLFHDSSAIVKNLRNNSTVEDSKNLQRKNRRIRRKRLSPEKSTVLEDTIGCYWCQVCFRFLTRKSDFDHHLRSHGNSKIHKCKKCSKQFSAFSLHQHLQEYMCKQCGTCFTTKNLLDQHLYVDEGIRNHVCKTCGKSFSLKEYLKKHEVLRHQDAIKYSCDTCGKYFTCRLSLTQHFLTHEGIRRYMCEICGKTFVHKSTYTKHKIFHIGIKSYACETCDKRFVDLRTLARHLLVHNGLRNHICDKCGRAFSRKDNLNVHVASHNRH